MNSSNVEQVQTEESAEILTTAEIAYLLNRIDNGEKAYDLMTPETANHLIERGFADWSYDDYGIVVRPAGKKFADEYLQDEKNPNFLFSMTAVELLVAISNGKIRPVDIARMQLAARGLDQSGKWVGFDKAAKIAITRNRAD